MDKVLALIIGALIVIVVKVILIKIGWSMFIMPVFGIRDIGFSEIFGAILLFNGLVNTTASFKKE